MSESINKHYGYSEGVCGIALFGIATNIKFVKSNNPFETNFQLKLKKTRGRNSICYIDKILEINFSDKSNIYIDNLTNYPTIMKKYLEDKYYKIKTSQNPKLFTNIKDVIIGDLLVGFCEKHNKIERYQRKSKHNQSSIKFFGNPAICYIDVVLESIND